MTKDVSKNWFQTLPGILTSVAALITALTGLVAAINFWFPKNDHSHATAKVEKCIHGYVWREATPEDHVCSQCKLTSKLLRTTCSLVRGVIQQAVLWPGHLPSGFCLARRF